MKRVLATLCLLASIIGCGTEPAEVLSHRAKNWGPCEYKRFLYERDSPSRCPQLHNPVAPDRCDLNNDGCVDLRDFAVLQNKWPQCSRKIPKLKGNMMKRLVVELCALAAVTGCGNQIGDKCAMLTDAELDTTMSLIEMMEAEGASAGEVMAVAAYQDVCDGDPACYVCLTAITDYVYDH